MYPSIRLGSCEDIGGCSIVSFSNIAIEKWLNAVGCWCDADQSVPDTKAPPNTSADTSVCDADTVASAAGQALTGDAEEMNTSTSNGAAVSPAVVQPAGDSSPDPIADLDQQPSSDPVEDVADVLESVSIDTSATTHSDHTEPDSNSAVSLPAPSADPVADEDWVGQNMGHWVNFVFAQFFYCTKSGKFLPLCWVFLLLFEKYTARWIIFLFRFRDIGESNSARKCCCQYKTFYIGILWQTVPLSVVLVMGVNTRWPVCL